MNAARPDLSLRISLWCLALALFAAVLVAPGTFFPFIGAKAYWFRFLVSAALAAFLWWIGFSSDAGEAWERVRRAFREPLVLTVLGFVAAFLLATVFAADPYLAFWSNYERGEGGFQMLYYAAFFALLALVPKSRGDWRLLLWAMLAAALGVIFYGLLAALGITDAQGAPIFLGPNEPSQLLYSRFWGSLGNPAYAGAYLLFASIFAGLLWRSERAGFMRATLVGVIAVFLTFLLLSQSRGAFLGLIAGGLAVLWYLGVRKPRAGKWFLGAALGVTLLFSTLVFYRESPAVKGIPVFGRLLRISLTDRSIETRMWVWQAALLGFRERPLFGWGPENFARVFDAHFDTRHFVPGEPSDTWYDRAHNVLIDYAAETGFLGLAAYLGIFGVLYRQLFRSRKRLEESEGLPFVALLFAFPVSYLVAGMVLFEVLPIYLCLFLFLGFSTHLLLKSRP